jgi:hypothetical protein
VTNALFVGAKTVPTADGDYVAGGYRTDTSGKNPQAWVTRLSPDGSILWQEEFGTGTYPYLRDLVATAGGGCVFVADGGTFGVGLVELDATGAIVWQKEYTGLGTQAEAVRGTSDGGFVVLSSVQTPATVTRVTDLMKVDSAGNLLWHRRYPVSDLPGCLSSLSSGGYVLSQGATVVGVDAAGNVLWSKRYQVPSSSTPGTEIDAPFAGLQGTPDGGFLGVQDVADGSQEFVQVAKIDPSGTPVWFTMHGGSDSDREAPVSIETTSDGGSVVAAWRIGGSYGGTQARLTKLSSSGSVEWHKSYSTGGWGGSNLVNLLNVQEAPDGGFVSGGTFKNWTTGASGWAVLKTNPDGTCPPIDSDVTQPSVSGGFNIVTTAVTVSDVTTGVSDSTATPASASFTVVPIAP